MERRRFLGDLAATTLLAASASAAPRRPRRAGTFTATDTGFALNGRPFTVRSGSMHYPRVPRPYWRDRMRKLRALGLNTLCTYVFWNAHEPRPGQFDFTGQLDLAAYLSAAQAEGLYVILRPGPYVCTEWDFGGFPAWLLAPQPAGDQPIQVRSADPRFLAAAGRYLQRVGREVAPLLISRGGPVILAQVENEYGSYGHDHAYMEAVRGLMRRAGFDVQMFTSDGPGERSLGGGTLPDLPCAINFGDDEDPEKAFAVHDKFRPKGPRMNGEFWVGWFDHWGERHHTTPPAHAARGLDWMLSHGCSSNLYMAHGGTSFGFMAGANFSRRYQPDTTSYDYDAPLDEAGRPTAKFHALQAVYRKHLDPGERLPVLPKPLDSISIAPFELPESAPLDPLLGGWVRAEQPLPMETLGASYGLVWYRTKPAAGGKGQLSVHELRDYARVFQRGRYLGEMDRSRDLTAIEIELAAGTDLDIVVECMGRINFGSRLQDNRQGITDHVDFDGHPLTGWSMVPLPLDDQSRLRFAAGPARGPCFRRGQFHLDRAGDSFLDLRGWGKGFVWVNDHNLGRFWDRGPQQSLYLPGCWLRKGVNQVVVFAWTGGGRQLHAAPDPVFGGAAYLDSTPKGNS